MSILKYRKRGISMELENKLNEFLADLNVFYRKLQNYHWNVQGKDFFQVHAKLEELYNEINEQIDEIAEHILILGGQPLGTVKDYLDISTIKEAENKTDEVSTDRPDWWKEAADLEKQLQDALKKEDYEKYDVSA